jgi:large subunit ribosomal protein L25
MDAVTLDATVRNSNGRHTRLAGQIPAIYYGKAQKNMELQMEYGKFRKVFENAGENTVIEMTVDGKMVPVLVKEIQYDPVSDRITHVDFIHVDMKKEVTATVKIVPVGVCPAVKNLGGILDLKKHEIKIKCLPKDLIHSIEVDVSGIADFHTSIHVKDLVVPAGIKVLDHADDTVITASMIKIEVETPVATAAPAGDAASSAAAGTAAPQAGSAPVAAPAENPKK